MIYFRPAKRRLVQKWILGQKFQKFFLKLHWTYFIEIVLIKCIKSKFFNTQTTFAAPESRVIVNVPVLQGPCRFLFVTLSPTHKYLPLR